MHVLPATRMAHRLLKDKLHTAVRAIDATAGNGHDTLFLARFSPSDARVQAFDIQQAALAKTATLLAENQLADKVELIHDSHLELKRYNSQPVDIIMFNLGYLPGGQHSLTTMADTTLPAVEQALTLLADGGMITIVAYPGHEEGQRELDALTARLEGLDQTAYTVALWRMMNQVNQPPVLLMIEKQRQRREVK